MNILKINGQALEGIYVDAAISFNKPAKRVSTYSVPGRNGDLVIDEGTFDNVLITYPVFEKSTFPTKFDEIVNYLASLEGYQRIECSNDPQHYRLGRFVVPQNPTAKRLNRDGYWQLSFDCKPQRWFLSGEEDTEIDANPIDEYSGDIVSFEAVALDEITERKAAIEPVQNLNGQANPYPAGGGKNLSPNPSLTAASSGGASVTTTGKYGENYINGKTYTISFDVKQTNSSIFRLRLNNVNLTAWATGTLVVGTRMSKTFTVTEDGYLNFWADSGCFTASAVVLENIQIEEGSTATAYAPYSNICPITGWSAANVSRTGVNIWDEETEVISTNLFSKNFIKVEPSTDYYISTAGYNIQVSWYDEFKNAISNITKRDTTITSPNNAHYMKFFTASSYGTTYNHNISINYPSTDTAYHAYLGTTATLSFGQTVYGGTLNVTTGVLTITDKYFSLTNAMLYGDYGGHPLYYVNIPDYATEPIQRVSSTSQKYGTIISNYFKEISELTAAEMANGEFRTDGSTPPTRFYFRYDEATDLTAINAMFASTPLQVVATLATPTTVQLTPTEVTTLLGQNNIWADTGDVEVKVTTPTVFNNPGLFNSKPLIRVYGVGTFRVNDITVTIASHDKPYIDIDCELQECYCGSENMNEYVSFSGNDFPELQPGDNYMLLASGITKLDVTPRWWIL